VLRPKTRPAEPQLKLSLFACWGNKSGQADDEGGLPMAKIGSAYFTSVTVFNALTLSPTCLRSASGSGINPFSLR
jgi:hypothetical protein